jgi:tetratricopeptide (TPR) repeat protein
VYVAPKELPGASEFAGTYPLGDSIRLPVALTDSAPATGLVRQALTNRAAGLASFIDAVGYLSLERFSDAVRYLQAASRSTGWQGPKAQGLLELFLGNATAKLPQSQKVRLDKAEGFYRAALGHVPGFTRARLGLAEVAFQRAHGTCTKRDVDRGGLERTLAQFNSVLKASAQAQPSEQSLLAAKARFGLGRIYLCQSQAELAARWPDAERELVAVTKSYRNDDLLRDDAAEAFGDLAIVALPGSRVRDRRDAYITAEADYSRAIKLTRDPTSLPTLHANRAFVETRLGERSAAEADEQTAAHLQKQTGGPH